MEGVLKMRTDKQIEEARKALEKDTEARRVALEKEAEAKLKGLEAQKAAQINVLDMEKAYNTKAKAAEEAKKEAEAKVAEAQKANENVRKAEEKANKFNLNINEEACSENSEKTGKKVFVRTACIIVATIGLLGATHHIGKAIANCANLEKAPITQPVDENENETNLIFDEQNSEDKELEVVDSNEEDGLPEILVAAESIYNAGNNAFIASMGYSLEDVENVVAVLNNQPIINQNAIINSAEEVEVFLNAIRNEALTAARAGNEFDFNYASLYANDTDSMEYKVLNAIDMNYDNVNSLESAIRNIDSCVDVLLGYPLDINGISVSPINVVDENAMGVLSYAILAYDAYDSITYNNGESILMDNGITLDENGNQVVGVVEGRRQSFSISLHNIDKGCQDNLELTRGN